MIEKADPAEPGDIVAVYDREGNAYGAALYNPRSQIALRIIYRGDPNDFKLDDYLDEKISCAVGLRRDILKLDGCTDAYRLIHDYGDGLPGLTADRYGNNIVLEFYSLGMYSMASNIEKAFRKHFPEAVFHHRASSYTQKMEGFELPAEDSENCKTRIRENGIMFEVDLRAGYKTGFFCDQRENRLYASQFAAGKTVIDLCSYTGGFGLYAAKLGGASEVTCVELDSEVCAMAKRNANINQVKLNVACGDAFMYIRQMIANGNRYGLVVLDPYKLVSSREEMEIGLNKYKDFNRIALSLVEPGGIYVTCSCSGLVSMEEFSFILRGAAHRAGRRVQILRKAGAGPDHPVMTEYPEGEYLKCITARVL